MPRGARIDSADAVHHIMARGIERKQIFDADADRDHFLHRLGDILLDTGTTCFAWSLMPNHFHLLLRTGNASIAQLMRRILSGYAGSFNRRYRRVGHLFQNRYKSILCQEDAYFLELVRYIHLNPLRAGLVADPADYPWSGHRAYLGLAAVPWLTTDFTLRLLGTNRNGARRAYARLISAGGDPDDSAQFSRGMPGDTRVLGDDGFLARVAATRKQVPPRGPSLPTLEQLIAAAAKEAGCTTEALASASKARALADARCHVAERALAAGVASIGEIARRLNRSHSSLIEALQRRR